MTYAPHSPRPPCVLRGYSDTPPADAIYISVPFSSWREFPGFVRTADYGGDIRYGNGERGFRVCLPSVNL